MIHAKIFTGIVSYNVCQKLAECVGDRKEDMWLYHIFKLIMLLSGFITMFDTAMFLLSFDTQNYVGWKHQA